MTFATGLIGLRRHGRIAMLLLALAAVRPTLADDETAGPDAQPGVSLAEPELPEVRLNHFSATWESVLNQLADDTGCTLIMHDVPSGRYSRRDWKKHTPREAVQILNQQLEPMGYRILMKDRFLTVIEIQRTRTEYPRHEVRSQPTQPEAGGLAPIDMTPAGPGTGTGAGAGSGLFEENGAPRFRPLADLSRQRTPETFGSGIVRVADEQPAVREESTPAEEPVQTHRVPTRQPASEIAGQLYEAFSDRSELIDMGPTGLPAFQAFRRPLTNGQAIFGEQANVDRPAWFVVEVDGQLNSLTVHAAGNTAQGVAALIRKLDVPPVGPGEALRLVTDSEDAETVAERLNKELRMLREGRQQIQLAQQPDDPAAQPTTPQPGEAGEATPMEQMEFPELIGNLRGDVSVEALPELDMLILRGNEEDVEAVMAVIRTIEAMAKGATPEIRLHLLLNVDSEALAELLNSVYESLGEISSSAAATRQTRPVNVIPVGNPNAILILAAGNSMEAIVELVELLDLPVPPGTEVQVFRLRSAVASQVVATLETFYADRPGLGTEIRIIADVRTNSVIVNARPNELTEVRRLVRQIDRDTTRGIVKLQHVRLQHALADEVAEFMTTVVQSVLNPAQAPTGQAGFGAGGQAAQELRDTRSVVLEYLATDTDAQRLIRSGLLTDVRFNADLRTNTLIITAPDASLKFFEELVRVLDQPTTTVADIKVFPLRNADAAAAAELLQSLFPEPEEGELGVQVAGTADGSSGLVPLRVSVDLRTNSIIAVGSQDVLDVVGAILFRLDSGEQLNRETRVLRLHNNPAFDIADAINQFLQSQRDLLQLDPDRISGSQLLEQEIIVTPEPISNTLIISATERYFPIILELAQELDREPEQVMIQALIVEVVLEDTDEFGVELGFQDSLLFDRSVVLDDMLTTISETTTELGVQTTTQRIISQSSTPGFAFNNNPLGNNTAIHPSAVGTQGLSNFGFGRTNTDLGFGGLVLSASSEAVSVLIRALASRRDINILSRPQVLALDNQLAQIQVGQVVPIVSGFSPATATSAAVPIVEQDDAGIILTVTPRISPDGQIVMEVAAEKSQYIDEGVALFTDIATGVTVESPVKDITTALTTVKVPDGQTVVMGGMITRSETNDERKVPWLGDIPIIGNIFGYDLHSHRRTELLIFLTPRIIHNDADSELIKQIEMDRLHFFEDQAEMIHGPIFGVPAPQSSQPPIDLYDRGTPPGPGTIQEPLPLPPPPPPVPGANDGLRPMSATTPADGTRRGVVQLGR